MENNILLTDRELLISKLAIFLDTARRDHLSVDDLLELQGEFQPSTTQFHTTVSCAASDACPHHPLKGCGHQSCLLAPRPVDAKSFSYIGGKKEETHESRLHLHTDKGHFGRAWC